MKKKILIFIVTYQSSFRLISIMDKLKKINQKNDAYKILIRDDCSTDDTIEYIKKIKTSKKIKIILNKKNLGYGANIKKCLGYAIKRKFDYAIMIHGDDQYDSRYIPNIVKNLKKETIDIVTGSRMIKKRDALKGGMPLYKFIGNKVITFYQNFLLSTNFSEFHSGYRVYKVSSLKKVPFQLNSNDYCFDTEIIIQFVKFNLKILLNINIIFF